ncbi:MAG TPA: cardiolipin synthase [Mobilitalea sp.]|nr:cardiolipin synthase [Mobilitalea sp.]
MNNNIREEVTGTIKGYLSGFLRAAIVGLLVILQFILVFYFSYLLRGYSLLLYSLLQLLSIIIIIILVNDDRNVSYKISWICIIAVFPITGYIMFVLWGNHRGKKLNRRILEKLRRGHAFLEYNQEVIDLFTAKYPTKSRMTRYLESNHFPLYKNNKIDYYPMAEDAFEAIFEEIEKAERFILIDFYIIGEGVLWDKMHKLLLRKLDEKVRVLFLYDDFGAVLRTNKNFRKSLESEGFEIRVFNPIHKYTNKLYMNYRSHQKIIVVDGNVGFTGGMNLADEYVNLVPRFGVWKDNAIKLSGDAVWGLTVTFLQMWEVSSAGEQVDYDYFKPNRKFEENEIFCQVIADGPANNPENPIENIYKQMIYYAKKVLYITTPYLIIEDDMRDALVTAAISGIDVRIITPFIPDKKNVKYLTNYNYGSLLEAGVRIFEYLPGFIHAKTIVSEDSGIIGTINMDYRSFHLQYECGVWICNKDVIHTISEDLLKTMEQCREVTYEEWKNRPWYLKMYQMFLNLFSTLM